MKRILFSIGSLAGLLILAACASAGASGGDLTGKLWGLTSLNGAAPVAGAFVSAEFTPDGMIYGRGGCNSFVSNYTVNGGSITIKAPMASTMMMCEQAVMDQETAYFQALGAAKTYLVSGDTLTLSDAKGNQLVVYTAQSRSLPGTAWEVVGYNRRWSVSRPART
jgi:heat shock protein HslJ